MVLARTMPGSVLAKEVQTAARFSADWVCNPPPTIAGLITWRVRGVSSLIARCYGLSVDNKNSR